MANMRRERLANIVWERQANEKRKTLLPKLMALGCYDFLDEKQSMEMGERFWSVVGELEYIDPSYFARCLEALYCMNPDKRLLWFHRNTQEVGVIVARLDVFNVETARLRGEFGPDILVAECNFEFGLCFEQEESDTYLRCWGIGG